MNKKNGKGNLYLYLMWPIWISLTLVIVNINVYFANKTINIYLLLWTILLIGISIYLYLIKYNGLFLAIENFFYKMAKAKSMNIVSIESPYAILDTRGKILWANDSCLNLSKEFEVGKNIINVFKDINKDLLKSISNQKISILTNLLDKKYKITFRTISLSSVEKDADYKLFSDTDKVIMVIVNDMTELYELKQENDDNKQVTGLINIDNYDVVTENMEDSKASMLMAMVDRKLTRYISNNSGIIKKLEKDKYFFVTRKKDIEDMIKDRFSILDQAREILGEDNIPLTLSIGVGYEGKSIETNHDNARIAMDMALGRGGDQAVVKKGQELLFFGGKSNSSSSTQRVKARVKATSFREMLDTKDKVLILGHYNQDMDSFGASIGVYCMANFLGKEVHIVQNTLTNAVKDMKNRFLDNEIYCKDLFIDGNEALSIIDENTLLVIVDHNNNHISDEKRLLENASGVVVFDHHRLQANSIQDTLMTYIDPSASSTCELISELVRYFDDRIKIHSLEAEAMLAGIMVDTINFTYQTNVKTFDAASYLKKSGADIDKIKKLLRIDFESEKIKHDVVMSATLYNDAYAIAFMPENNQIETSVIKAEIANELINIKNVKASIVVSKENEKFSISSRSIDDINVQVLMEKLGGGGHRGSAGATVVANDISEVEAMIKNAIDTMISDKEALK